MKRSYANLRRTQVDALFQPPLAPLQNLVFSRELKLNELDSIQELEAFRFILFQAFMEHLQVCISYPILFRLSTLEHLQLCISRSIPSLYLFSLIKLN